MNIAIIPARGGSVRLPRKNILPFCGDPLIAWTITQAKCSKNIDEVFVVTDDEEIADISIQYGVNNIIMQPAWMKDKKPHAAMATTYALKEIIKLYYDVDILVTMLCTNPLVKPTDLDNGFTLFNCLQAKIIQPLQPMRELVLMKNWPNNEATEKLVSKDYEFLREGGNWTIIKAKQYLEYSKDIKDDEDWNGKWKMDDIINYFLTEIWQYADTDTLEEFEMAEVLMKHYILKGRGIEIYEEYKRFVKRFKKC